VYGIPIVPFPSQHDFFVGFEISKGEDAESEGSIIVFGFKRRQISTSCFLVADNGPEDSVGSAPVSDKPPVVSYKPCIESYFEWWAHEMNVRFRHTKVGVSIERVGQVRR